MSNMMDHKQMAALHEAGHVIVIQAKGGTVACSWIYPNDTADAVEDHLWLGRTQFYAQKFPVYAVAGDVAESLARDPEEDVSGFVDYLELFAREMSETDASFLPDGRDGMENAVKEAMAILRKYDREFREVVCILLDDERGNQVREEDLNRIFSVDKPGFTPA